MIRPHLKCYSPIASQFKTATTKSGYFEPPGLKFSKVFIGTTFNQRGNENIE